MPKRPRPPVPLTVAQRLLILERWALGVHNELLVLGGRVAALQAAVAKGNKTR